jgi:hypothetical protein
VPRRELDLHHRAESRGDRTLIFFSLSFLSLECLFVLAEMLFLAFNHHGTKNDIHIEVKIADILFTTLSLVKIKNDKIPIGKF